MVHKTLIRFWTGSIPATASNINTGLSFNGRTGHLQCSDRGSIPRSSTRFCSFTNLSVVSKETQHISW